MLFSPQIPLQLEPSREQGFGNFVTGANEACLESLCTFISADDVQVFMSGPQSSGKTHLLSALCLEARSQGLTAFYAGLKGMPEGGQALLEGLEHVDLLCIDDLDAIAGTKDWEIALFHCINRFRDTGKKLVVASGEPLSALNIELPDLVSRLQWGLRLKLVPPDDAGKLRVLNMQAKGLGIELPDEVARYLIRRSSRHLGTLIRVVERLQLAAFASKRRITVPLARQIIGAAGTGQKDQEVQDIV